MRTDSAEPRSYFHWKDFSVLQRSDVLKIGTDAILLGSWITSQNLQPQSVLDAGTGTGILALIAASHFPAALVDAIDIQSVAVELARFNFENSKWKDRLSVRQADIFSENDVSPKVDLIICNPPYFFNQLHSPDDQKALSRHSISGIAQWMKAFKQRLSTNGYLSLVLPSDNSHAWIAHANDEKLFLQKRMDVYSFEKDEKPVRTIMLFGNDLQRPVFETMVMYDEAGNYSVAYQMLTGLLTKPGEGNL